MPELTRKPMTTRSACEAVGANADVALKEIAEITRQAGWARRKVAKRKKALARSGGGTQKGGPTPLILKS